MFVQMRYQFAAAIIPLLCATFVVAGERAVPIGKSFSASDTLPAPADSSSDALDCLKVLSWTPGAFEVQCEESMQDGVHAVVRFPTARPLGNEQSDRVAIEWYAVTDESGDLTPAPAVVVVHESGSGMTVGRIVAQGLRERGMHALMLQLPYYGLRRPPGQKPQGQNIAYLMGQGVSDARRALDAVKVLPGIERERVSLLGISLGGFISATTAGLDGQFDQVFILLAGGNLPELIATGERETAQLRELLAQQGYTGEKMKQLVNQMEPNRLAHRIPKDRLWLYSATHDNVVPPSSSESFAKAAGLDPSHHCKMLANHYSGILFMPAILDDVVRRIRREPAPVLFGDE